MGRRLNIESILNKPARGEYSDDLNRKHKPDYRLVLYMGLLMMVGLIVIYAIGPARANVLNNAYGSDYGGSYFFIKQFVSLLVAVGAFMVVALVPFKWLLNNSRNLLVFGLASCLLLAVAGWTHSSIAQCSLGACRWFDLGPLGSVQPAEILKFGLMVFLATFLAQKIKMNKLNDNDETLIPLAILAGVAVFFVIILQKDMGTGLAILSIIGAMLIAAGIDKSAGVKIGLVALAAIALLIVVAPHRIERIATFLKGDNTSVDDADSYHVEHAKIALGTGGLFGLGVGNSVQATGYLPEAINDSVFAIIGETFGFFGVTVILVLFYAMMMRMLKIMDHMVEIRLKLLVAGVFGWFGSHVMLNIASMIGIFPLTGITLPFLSFGGTSLIFIAAALGLVFQLSHYTVHPSRLKEVGNENIGSRRGIGRSRHSSRRGSS